MSNPKKIPLRKGRVVVEQFTQKIQLIGMKR